jgi:hypothetical protein
MKTHPTLVFAVAALSAALPHVLTAAAKPKPSEIAAAEATPSHVLFMGADFWVDQGKKEYRVKNVQGSRFVVDKNGKAERVPTEFNRLKIRIAQQLKLTTATARIDKLKGERAYTPQNDPAFLALKQQGMMAQVGMEMEDGAHMRMAEADRQLASTQAAAAAGGMGSPQAEAALPGRQKAFDAATQAYDVATSINRGELTDGSFHQSAALDELGRENYDAMSFELEVSSEKPLGEPYVVMLTRFREKDGKPGVSRNWIYAKSLDPIGTKPQKVRVLQGGFPLGFILEDFEVRLYDGGTEIATNVSPKRVPLTREEAFQYQLIEHLSQNKSATVPAEPVMAALPEDFASRLAAGQGQQVYWVEVSNEGLVTAVYADERYSKKVDDPYFVDAVRRVWFKPALEKGKPVQTRTALNVASLAL